MRVGSNADGACFQERGKDVDALQPAVFEPSIFYNPARVCFQPSMFYNPECVSF